MIGDALQICKDANTSPKIRAGQRKAASLMATTESGLYCAP